MRVAFFVPGSAGKLFCSGERRAEQETVSANVLVVPPLAEEMNKSRHVLATIVRAAGARGCDALLPDLFGTGDSEGDFSQATLDIWRADLDRAIAELSADAPLHLVCLRAGALLGLDAVQRHAVSGLTLLQPQTDGRQVINQFLRLRMAGGLVGGREKESAAQLRAQLAAGEILEVGGYGLSGALAEALEQLSFGRMREPQGVRVDWFEFVNQADRPLLPVSQRIVDQWAASGVDVTTHRIVCDTFWATQEIAHCAELAGRVVDAILQ